MTNKITFVEAIDRFTADPSDFASEQEFCNYRRFGRRWLRAHGFSIVRAPRHPGWQNGKPVKITLDRHELRTLADGYWLPMFK